MFKEEKTSKTGVCIQYGGFLITPTRRDSPTYCDYIENFHHNPLADVYTSPT